MIADLAMQSHWAFTPEDLVREVKHLPSSPKVLPKLKHLLCDENSAMHEIVELIRLDVGIAARVLHLANSVVYSKGALCHTVEEAVNRVGYSEIYQLVSYAVASQVLVRPLGVYGIEADELWKLSVAGALAAEMLAIRTRQDRAAAYTVGLLHCVGMVAIDEWALRHAHGLTLKHAGFPREAVESERATFGFTQAETGAALLRHWEFPAAMSEPVRWQYAPRASAGHTRMASLLHAAKWLRTAACAAGKAPALDVANLQPLGLGAAALQAMVPELKRKLAAVDSLLDAVELSAADGESPAAEQRFPVQDWDEVA